ncbi:MAG: TonB-dependent receptor plug domain-containing protein [Saprospiraceae bacterium]|nr:TonB-dependent receptor plug domain-containing protein [Saprospiraceae bacterium]
MQISAQDTLNLVFRQLGREDVLIANENTTQQVASGSRSLKDIKDVPFTIYVVSKEEIQKYGFVTLADVLKSMPGIMVAQPSSGSLGEAFLMRGLLGNVYAKILINDLPVKPSAVEGMPIGAQLPIQQAERIEVTFGPTIGIYGGDAAAGVINIITTQTERPFYVQADVGLGSQGYSNLSVLLAGKVGRDKEVVKFSIFGSYTDFEDRRVVYDKDNLYNPSNYISDSSTFFRLNNYRGTIENPAFKDLPHQSKLIGAQLNYKAFRFYFEQLERQDHSAIGLNPVTVSYANPSTYTGESITRLNAGFVQEREKWVFRLDATGILYQLDPGSSTLLVQNNLYNGVRSLIDSSTSNFDTLRIRENEATIYQQLLSNQRFSYAASNDVWIEPLLTMAATNWLEFSLGGSFQFSNNQPFINYLPVPFESDNIQNQREQQLGFQNIAYQPDKEQFNNIAFYFQQYLNFDKFDVLGAVRYDYHSKYQGIWSGHLAGNYKLGETLSARVSYGTAFQVPNTFWEASSLGLTFLGDSLTVESAYSFGHPALEYLRNRSFEVGLRWGSKDNFETDIVYFRSNTQNLIAQRQYLSSESPVVLIDAYEN